MEIRSDSIRPPALIQSTGEKEAALTVQPQDGGRERRRVGEGELHGVLFRPLQQLSCILALLLLSSLLFAFLLLSGQSLLGLFLLDVQSKRQQAERSRTTTIRTTGNWTHGLLGGLSASLQHLQLLLLFVVLLLQLLLLLHVHLLEGH